MDRTTSGWVSGLIGVLIFSGSLPATRVAVLDIRPAVPDRRRARRSPALLALGLLLALRQKRPARRDLASLAIVALGVVVGFPLLTALALQHVTSAHSIVFVGLLPLATAIFGVLRGGERPKPAFWLFSGLGSALVAGFALIAGARRLARRRPADARRHHRSAGSAMPRARSCRARSAAGRSSPGRWSCRCR